MHVNPFWKFFYPQVWTGRRDSVSQIRLMGDIKWQYMIWGSQKQILGLWPSAMRWHMVWCLVTNFSEQLAASIFRVEKVSLSQGHYLPSDHIQPCPNPHFPVRYIILLLGSLLLPWRWRPNVSFKMFIVMYQTAQCHIPKDWSLNELTCFCTSVTI
jgi:hypothetical protein